MKHIIIAVILIISNVFLGIAKPMKSQAEIYFAGGCFWGTEHFLKQIRGVESTQVGYANSTVANPSYEQVCSGKTNAAETVKVVYDPEEVNLSLLLNLYFQTIDPTSLNRGTIVVHSTEPVYIISIKPISPPSIRRSRH